MSNPTLELANLSSLLNTPNLSVLLVRVVIQGQIQVVATGPSSTDIVKVLLQPNSVQNLIDFAPVGWWNGSSSLTSAVQNGWLEVLTPPPEAVIPTGLTISTGPKFIVEPPGPGIGDMLVYNGNAWVLLPPGASGHVVTSNGPGFLPTYQPGGGGGSSGSIITVNCASSLLPGDIVYVSGVNTVAKATATGGNHAIGIIQNKPSATTAEVVLSGQTLPIFSFLTPGLPYYLSTTGTLTSAPPSGTGGTFIQKIGTAQSSDTLLLSISKPYTVQEIGTVVTITSDESTELNVFVVVGSYALSGVTFSSLNFATISSVTSLSLSGEIQLWDVGTMSQVALHTISSTSPTEQTTSLPIPVTPVIYEVRHRVTGGTSISDRVNTSWAGLRMSAMVPNI